jgi:hypothetical protein
VEDLGYKIKMAASRAEGVCGKLEYERGGPTFTLLRYRLVDDLGSWEQHDTPWRFVPKAASRGELMKGMDGLVVGRAAFTGRYDVPEP